MKAPKLWIYNYDFEFELAGIQRIVFHGKHLAPWYFLNRSGVVLIPFADEQDSILIQELPDERVLTGLESLLGYRPKLIPLKTGLNESNSLLYDFLKNRSLVSEYESHQPVPWGWSLSINNYQETIGFIKPPRFTVDTVKLINSKHYSAQVRKNLLPKTFDIPSLTITDAGTTKDEIKTVLAGFQQLHSQFFIKNFYGTSGKLSDFCSSETFSIKKIEKYRRWIQKNEGVLFEKFISKKKEISVQVDIQPDETIIPVAVTELFSAKNGSYIGNILTDPIDTVLNELHSQLLPVLKNIAEKGYHGPLGIDLIETENGEYKLLEINARLTMGRVAFEWHRKINCHKTGLFANLFFKEQHISFPESLDETAKQLEKNFDCRISILNSVHSKINRSMLVTIFIAANTKNILLEVVQKIKPALFQ